MIKSNNKLFDRFWGDIQDHKMEVIMDDGKGHRHLRFKRPDSRNYYFDLVTWNGYLTICGDMGTYVFTRITDMFEFFREDDPDQLRINCGYWAEKCVSESKFGEGVMEFSPELFEEAVKHEFNLHLDDLGFQDDHGKFIGTEDDQKYTDGLWDALEEEVLNHAHDGSYPAIDAAMTFSWYQTGRKNYYEWDRSKPADFTMHDFYEHRTREYTFHYVWCLFAIVWGIREYDNAKHV